MIYFYYLYEKITLKNNYINYINYNKKYKNNYLIIYINLIQ